MNQTDTEQEEENIPETAKTIDKNAKKEKKKRSKVSYAIEYAIYVALILLCIFWVPEHVLQRTVVKGESMENTLHTNESLLWKKFPIILNSHRVMTLLYSIHMERMVMKFRKV